MRYWQALKEGREMTHARSFLYTIAQHLVIDWYRKKKTDSLDMRMEAGYEPVAEGGAHAETKAEYQQILGMLNDLEEKDREVLVLRYVEGLEPKDIADVLGETANVVSVRLNRAIKRLQKKLHI